MRHNAASSCSTDRLMINGELLLNNPGYGTILSHLRFRPAVTVRTPPG